jgi:hypothetical protein
MDTPPPNRTHNMTNTAIYRVWAAMRNRCQNPKVKSFNDYGGRGIKVCERWQSFETFLVDMGPRPSPEYQIDRIDNDGDYEPSNCRWAKRLEQASNKRNNRFITANGETLHMAEWARRLGCQPSAILYRIDRAGWSEADAVTTPIPDRPNSKLTAGQVKEIRSLYPNETMQSVADKFGVSKKTVLNIIHRRIFDDV